MRYLLLSESEVQSVELTEKQSEIRDAVDRILSDEDPKLVARELLEREILTAEDINMMIDWIKTNRGKRKSKEDSDLSAKKRSNLGQNSDRLLRKNIRSSYSIFLHPYIVTIYNGLRTSLHEFLGGGVGRC